MRPDHVQIVHMAHERLIARAAGVGEFRARPPGQGHEFLRDRLDERHARDRRHFGRMLEGFRQKRSHRSVQSADSRSGQTAVSI